MIERSVTEKLGTRFLNGKEISAKDLMDNASAEAKKNNLVVGKALTKEQIAKLDKDIVWYEYQEVNGIQVLAPKVYLSQNTSKNLNLVAIDGDILNKSTVEKIEFNNGEFDRSKFTKIDSVGGCLPNSAEKSLDSQLL